MEDIFIEEKSFSKLKRYVKEELEKQKNLYSTIIDNYENNLEFTILKIICSTPLVYYKEIRESAFKWVIEKLELLRVGNIADYYGDKTNERIIGLENVNKKDEYLLNYFEVNSNNYYSEYQKLKFLLKRAVELKGNYIIHPTFFNSIEKLITTLFENGDNLKIHKEESDKNFIKKVKKLLKPEYNSRIKDLYNYIHILEKSSLFPKGYFENELSSFDFNTIDKENSIDADSLENPDLFNQPPDFKERLEALKKHPKYSITTSKEFVYYLVGLIQELVLDHETKSIRLKDNVGELIGVNKDRHIFNQDINQKFLTNLNNGDFLHYLRLLKLENTEITESYWQDFKKRELKNSINKKINSSGIVLEKDTKYKLAIRLSEEADLIKLFEIRAELYNKK